MSDVKKQLEELLELTRKVRDGELVAVPDGSLGLMEEIVGNMRDVMRSPLERGDFERHAADVVARLERIERKLTPRKGKR